MPNRHLVDPGNMKRTATRFVSSLLFSTGVGLLAHRRQSLDKSGVIGSIISGTSIVSMGGWSWGLSLVYFFLSSSLFSSFKARGKAAVASDKFSKGSRRDFAQVAANGGLATFFALCHGFSRTQSMSQRAQSGFIGALATATADTWATELGTLSKIPPRFITNGKPVIPGTSGGITPLGMAASAIGSCSLGYFFWITSGMRKSLANVPTLALISGMGGSCFDSFLGATFQAMYFCPTCQTETEQHIHQCGKRTKYLRGITWMNNDVVNGISTAIGSLLAIILDLFSA